ncbi:hypothetical protein [Streptomyces sp. NPDC048606]|uniref:hypothetical protein n=1 Tax=Streptomyces sp. NPDC048606 TaxID=3154726 RepID=UPI003446BFFE
MTGHDARRTDEDPARPAAPRDPGTTPAGERAAGVAGSQESEEKGGARRPTPADLARLTVRKARRTLGVPEV